MRECQSMAPPPTVRTAPYIQGTSYCSIESCVSAAAVGVDFASLEMPPQCETHARGFISTRLHANQIAADRLQAAVAALEPK